MRDTSGNPVISMYATDDETREFVRGLTDAELTYWARQQDSGSTQAELAEDRASHARGAQIAHRELKHRS